MTKSYTISLEDLVTEAKSEKSFGPLWTLKVEEIVRNVCNPYPLQYYGFPELAKEDGKWPDKAILEVLERTIIKKILPKDQHIWMAVECNSISQVNGNIGRLVQWALWDMRTPLITDNLVRRTKKILAENFGIATSKKRQIPEAQFSEEVSAIYKCIEPYTPVERTSEVNPKKGEKFVRNPKVFNTKTLIKMCEGFVSLNFDISDDTLRDAFERKLHGKPGTLSYLDLVARYEVGGDEASSETDILDTLGPQEREELTVKAEELIETLEPSEERCLYLLRMKAFFVLSQEDRAEALGVSVDEIEELILNMQSKIQSFCKDREIRTEQRAMFQELIWTKIGINSGAIEVISNVAP